MFQVKKVIISGEMPEWCYACDFWNNNIEYQSDYCRADTEPYLCDILNREIDQNIFKVNRPDWCPLEKYCEICDGVGFVLHATQGTMPCPECNQESEE